MSNKRGLTQEASADAGFTLAELLIAVSLFMTVSGMSVALVGSAVPSIRTDSEVNRLIGMLQVARETAITRQRDVEVRFDEATDSILLLRHDEGVEVPMQELRFEYSVRLHKFDGMEADTQEAYPDAGVVDFGGATSLTFAPDGSFLGNDDVPVNGTIFLGVEGKPETARAITMTGTTARTRYYRWQNASGITPAGWVAK